MQATTKQWSIILVFILLTILIQALEFPAADVTWLLHISKLWLAGGQYGNDFIEINPPLILLIYSLPTWLATHLHIDAMTVTRYEIIVMALISIAVCQRLCALYLFTNNKKHQSLFIATLGFVFFIMPANQFMQRENIMIILSTPYLLLIAVRLNGFKIDRRLAVLIGSLAALGVALKPHFLLLPCLVELAAMLRLKKPLYWWRPEIITMLIFFSIYLIIIFLLFPHYSSVIINHYFKYYINYARQPTIRLLQTDSAYCMFAAIFVYLLLYKKIHYFNLNLVLLSSTAAGFLIYFLEGQLWYYHAIPVTSYSFIFFSLILLSTHQSEMGQSYQIVLRNIIASIIIALGFLFIFSIFFIMNYISIEIRSQKTSITNQLITYINQHKIKKIYFIGISFGPIINAINYTPSQYVSKYSGLLMLFDVAKLLHDNKNQPQVGKQQAPIIKETQNLIITAIQQKRPDLVIIDSLKINKQMAHFNLNLVDFLAQDKRFKKIWKNYHLVWQNHWYAWYEINHKQHNN